MEQTYQGSELISKNIFIMSAYVLRPCFTDKTECLLSCISLITVSVAHVQEIAISEYYVLLMLAESYGKMKLCYRKRKWHFRLSLIVLNSRGTVFDQSWIYCEQQDWRSRQQAQKQNIFIMSAIFYIPVSRIK